MTGFKSVENALRDSQIHIATSSILNLNILINHNLFVNEHQVNLEKEIGMEIGNL